MAGPGPPAPRSPVSRWLSRVDRYASSPLASALVIGAAATWIVVSIAAGIPARWEIIFQTLVAALTLVMVFVIQHTQARHQRATHLGGRLTAAWHYADPARASSIRPERALMLPRFTARTGPG